MKSKDELYDEFVEMMANSTAKDRAVIEKKYSAYPPRKWWLAGWDARQGEVDSLKSEIVKLKSLIRKQMTTLNNVYVEFCDNVDFLS